MTGFTPQSLRLRRAEHSTPQQSNVGPAKHLPLEHLETVNVPLHRPCAPRQRQARFDRFIILTQATCKPLKRLQGALGSPLEPGIEPLGLTLAKQLSKVLCQIDGLGQLVMLPL